MLTEENKCHIEVAAPDRLYLLIIIFDEFRNYISNRIIKLNSIDYAFCMICKEILIYTL